MIEPEGTDARDAEEQSVTDRKNQGTPSTVRSAAARLRALRLARPADDAALARARRDLVVARAAALTAQAARLLAGERP